MGDAVQNELGSLATKADTVTSHRPVRATSKHMPTRAPETTCPFIRRLIVVLSEEEPISPNRQDALLFTQLLELEMDAEKRGASEASRRIIGRVRRIAGKAAMTDYPPIVRGH